MNRAELKNLAKQQLGGKIFANNWLMAVVIIIITTAISSACGYIPYVGMIAAIVISGPLVVGRAYVFLKLARTGEAINVGDVFEGFKNDFVGNFLLGLMTFIFTFLWTLLFYIPGIVKSYSYSMAPYIKVDNPEWGWSQCLNESKEITKGHKMDLFILDLSFIGWLLVGFLACCVGAIWVDPYVYATKANVYETLKRQ